MFRLFRIPGVSKGKIDQIRTKGGFDPGPLTTEWCFLIDAIPELTLRQIEVVKRYLAASYMLQGIGEKSYLSNCPTVVTIGPRLNWQTVQSSTTCAVFHACGVPNIRQIERAVRIGFNIGLSELEIDELLDPLFSQMVFDDMTEQRYRTLPEIFGSGKKPEPVRYFPLLEGGRQALDSACKELKLSLDEQDKEYFYNLFVNVLHRDPSDVELFMFGQEFSEHCSHGYWKGLRKIDGVPLGHTLLEYAQMPWKINPGNGLVGFGDDSSIYRGLRPVITLIPRIPGKSGSLIQKDVLFHPATSAESHCHPTLYEPFQGCATAVARVRDNVNVGLGGSMRTSMFGLAVGNLCIPEFTMPWEEEGWEPIEGVSALKIATQGRKGAWYFGNALGEPTIGGFFIAFGLDPGDGYRSYAKPIAYTFGHSLVRDEHLYKREPKAGMLLIEIGGPALPIGVGGGSMSSDSSRADNAYDRKEANLHSVQRGAPFVQNCAVRVIQACVDLGEDNPIITEQDLGAGGHSTAIPEVARRCGIIVELRSIRSGDTTMSTRVLVCNEAQERSIVVIEESSLPRFARICDRESCHYRVIGVFTGDGNLVMHDEWDDSNPVNFPLDAMFAERPQKTFEMQTVESLREPLVLPDNLDMETVLERMLSHPTVACKGWLTNRADRSVGGNVGQQQCIGPYQLPLCDYSVTAVSFLDRLGTANALGVQPHAGLISPEAMARITFAEALLNLCGALISDIADIKCEVNWFSAAKSPGEGVVLENVARTLAQSMIEACVAQLGGKDSSSAEHILRSPRGEVVDVKSPVTVVVAVSAQMEDLTCKVTPFIDANSELVHVDLSPQYKPLGASILSQVYGQTGNDCPDVNIVKVIICFKVTQELLRNGLITACHDISDGGIATTLLEMAFASGVGLVIETLNPFNWLEYYFSQVPGLIVACESGKLSEVMRRNHKAGKISAKHIGVSISSSNDPQISIVHNDQVVLEKSMLDLRAVWMEPSFQLDKLDANPDCIDQERSNYARWISPPEYKFPQKMTSPQVRASRRQRQRPGAAIVRAPGSNGDRELAGAVYQAGFEPVEIVTTDLIAGKADFDNCQFLLQAGGFSFQDEPLQAGIGWAAAVLENRHASECYRAFFARSDTLSYHPCNGMQVATLMGIVPDPNLPLEKRPVMKKNLSDAFESRWVTVAILDSPAVLFKGMAGSILGIPVAHGEGRLYCPDETVLEWILQNDLAPMRYLGIQGKPTESYPFNPNGSPYGIAGLCTLDGRHLATMPHIERVFEMWQWHWIPKNAMNGDSPWMKVFDNAYEWCMEHRM